MSEPGFLRGVAWTVLAAACVACMAGIVRHLAVTIHPLEIVFFRAVFGIVVLLPWLVRVRLPLVSHRRLGIFVFRSLLEFGSISFWIGGIALMPVADAIALTFTFPLFMTVLAASVIGETVRKGRWLATVVGFIGMLIIVRPGFHHVGMGVVCMLLAALFIAGSRTAIKILIRTETNEAIVGYLPIYMMPLTVVPALLVWRTPNLMELLWLLLFGGIGTLSQLCWARSYALADFAVVAPFEFTQLPFVAAIGFVVFGEWPDGWTWAGTAVIVITSAYLLCSGNRPESRHKPFQ